LISILKVADCEVRRTALIGFFIGMALGCLCGALTGLLPIGADGKADEMLSINQGTGRAQLHIKGKPEIK
jgi:ABC-type nitrate/sulfonate/bicarbonate transport system permease component